MVKNSTVMLLEELGVMVYGHYQLDNLKHTNFYVNKDLIFTDPYLFRKVRARFFSGLNKVLPDLIPSKKRSEIVLVGATPGGATLAASIALILDMPYVYMNQSAMQFGRCTQHFLKGKFVIILDDIVTTGKSILTTMNAADKCGASIAYILSLWDMGSGLMETINNYSTLINREVESWEPDDCPMCREGVKLLSPPNGFKPPISID